jgi:hypothetical protein
LLLALLVHDYPDYCCNLFLKAKSDLKDKFLNLLTDLKIAGLDVKFIQYDDLGEKRLCLKNVNLKDTM